MEIHTLDRGFVDQNTIDVFESAIWTERYFGDGDFQLVVEDTPETLAKLPKGQLLRCEGSDQPMILEERDIKDGAMTVTGIALPKWLNNRPIRVFSTWSVKEWNLGAYKTGHHINYLVYTMCVEGSPIFDGTWPIGIPVSEVLRWKIPGLVIGTEDSSGPDYAPAIPWAPLYDTVRQLAETYNVGMKIVIDFATDTDFQISFNTYSGLDRTSAQTIRDTIQFSDEMDTFANIRDLESLTDAKTDIWMFAPNAPVDLIGWPGYATNNSTAAGFDLRVVQEFAEDIDYTSMDAAGLLNALTHKATLEADKLKPVQLVDGEIIQAEGVEYGTNFFMGDLVEVVGNTGALQSARITEYIRSQDSAGERAYPGLTFVD